MVSVISVSDSNSVFIKHIDTIQDSTRNMQGKTLPINAIKQENITENNRTYDSLSNVERKQQLLSEMWRENENDNSSAYDSIISFKGKAPSLFTICSLATRSVQLKVGLEEERHTDNLTDPKDSLIFSPFENEAYKAIMEYQQLLLSNIQLTGEIPSIIHHNTQSFKNSLQILPKAMVSHFLKDRNFFFIGGGPFIRRYQTWSGKYIFNDPDNNPEIRLYCSENENTRYVLDAIMHLKKTSINISFGPPITSMWTGTKEVKGIGSIIHEFKDRIPVFFLTEGGIIPAHLISVSQILVTEGFDPIQNNPQLIFSCSYLPEKEILGVYIPYDSSAIYSCDVERINNLWTADINDDGIPEFACISDTYAGASSDNLAILIWYANINGEWIRIDKASENDST